MVHSMEDLLATPLDYRYGGGNREKQMGGEYFSGFLLILIASDRENLRDNSPFLNPHPIFLRLSPFSVPLLLPFFPPRRPTPSLTRVGLLGLPFNFKLQFARLCLMSSSLRLNFLSLRLSGHPICSSHLLSLFNSTASAFLFPHSSFVFNLTSSLLYPRIDLPHLSLHPPICSVTVA